MFSLASSEVATGEQVTTHIIQMHLGRDLYRRCKVWRASSRHGSIIRTSKHSHVCSSCSRIPSDFDYLIKKTCFISELALSSKFICYDEGEGGESSDRPNVRNRRPSGAHITPRGKDDG